MRSSPGSERPSPENEPGTDDSPEVTASEEPASAAGPREPASEELRSDLDETRARLAVAEDRYLRARADLDNYRKRADHELARRAIERRDELLLGWLEVVDSVERALSLEAQHPEAAGGLRAVLDQIEGILTRHGVTRLGGVGDRFDPELHEAVAVVRSPHHPDGTIADVLRSGYAVDGRLLRPAQVAVVRHQADGD